MLENADGPLLMQVGHALNMVAELPEWIEHLPRLDCPWGDEVSVSALTKHPLHALREAFVANVRVQSEQ